MLAKEVLNMRKKMLALVIAMVAIMAMSSVSVFASAFDSGTGLFPPHRQPGGVGGGETLDTRSIVINDVDF